MKILMFNTFYYPNIIGGAEKSTQILAESLVERGINTTVVSIGSEKKIEFINGVKVYYVNAPFLLKRWFERKNKTDKLNVIERKLIDIYNYQTKYLISFFLKEEKPDIIHTHNLYGFSTYIWKVISNYKLPIVHTLRDHYLLCLRGVMFKNEKNCERQCIECKLTSFYKRVNSKYVEAVVGVSKYILNRHLDYNFFKNASIRTHIYNPTPKINIKNKKIKKREKIILGYIGQLSKGKGIELLLKEFIKFKNEKIELHVYGKGTKSYEDFLKNKYQADNIKFMGFSKSENIYSDIDISIVPSLLNEAFPRIPLESYSYGIPVIASNKGGTPEAVLSGKTGFIFNSNKPDDLKEKIEIFTKNPHLIEEFSKNCIEFVKKFDKEKIVNQYIEVYKQVLKYYES